MKGSENPGQPTPPKQESVFLSLALNLIAPILILRQGSKIGFLFPADAGGWLAQLRDFVAQPSTVLVIALSFPAGYFIYDWRRRGKRNLVSILGFVSVLMTGGVGLLSLPRDWFLIKEALFPPGFIALVLLLSVPTRKPLISLLFFNRELFDVDRIEARLMERKTREGFIRALRIATFLLGLSFVASAIANYFLADYFVTTDPSDPANRSLFNDQVGSMMVWTWAFLFVPNILMTLGIWFYLMRAIDRFTGLPFEEAVAEQHRSPQRDA